MNSVTLRGALLWPILPTVALIFLCVGLSPGFELPQGQVVWIVAFYEVGVVLWVAWRAHRGGNSLGALFRPIEPRKHVTLAGWAVLGYFCLAIGGETVLSTLWTDLLKVLGLPPPGPASPGPTTWEEIPSFLLLAVVLAPLVEELLLRGLTFRVLRRWWGLIPGLVGQAIIFGFLHDQGMFWKVFLGVFLGILALRSGSLFVSWATHLCINLVATAFLILGIMVPQGSAATVDTGFEWPYVLIFAVGLWATYRFLRDTQAAWNPPRLSAFHRRLLWSLVRRHSAGSYRHAVRAPRHFRRRAELPGL